MRTLPHAPVDAALLYGVMGWWSSCWRRQPMRRVVPQTGTVGATTPSLRSDLVEANPTPAFRSSAAETGLWVLDVDVANGSRALKRYGHS